MLSLGGSLDSLGHSSTLHLDSSHLQEKDPLAATRSRTRQGLRVDIDLKAEIFLRYCILYYIICLVGLVWFVLVW